MGIIGPWFLAEQVRKWNLEQFKWDYKQTCQISWTNTKYFTDKEKTFDESRPFLHLFAEMWRVNNMNKNHFYKKGIYAKLLNRYEIYYLCEKLEFKPSFSFLSSIIKWVN